MSDHATSPVPGTNVWDLPTRLFHWCLAACVIVGWALGQWGPADRLWHMRLGEVVLALLLFRLAWGFLGGRHARFADFLCGPRALLAYLRGGAPGTPGHNPLGSLSVLAMLAVLAVQAVTGLFSDDDALAQGPLYRLAGDRVQLLTKIHGIFANLILVSWRCTWRRSPTTT